MEVSFRNLKKNVPAIISECRCSQRFLELGFLPGAEIKIIGECLLGGTVIVETKYGTFCARRDELDIDLNVTEEG